MNAAIFIYIADVLNSIGTALSVIGMFGFIAVLIFTVVHFIERDKYHGKNWMFVVPGIALAITCFIPSSKTMYMMAGAVIGESALNSKVGQQLTEMIELKLDQELKKMKEEKK